LAAKQGRTERKIIFSKLAAGQLAVTDGEVQHGFLPYLDQRAPSVDVYLASVLR
jgi:hypothetical protein